MLEELDLEELRKDYQERLKEGWDNEPRKEEIMDMALENTQGGLWILGGYLTRKLIKSLYDRTTQRSDGIVDVDFISEELVSHKEIYILNNWKIKLNRYEDIYFASDDGEYKIEFNSLRNFRPLVSKRLPTPRIEDVVSIAPLNVQAIAWDLIRNRLIGNEGIKAIKNQKVEVNNRESLERVVIDLNRFLSDDNMKELVCQKAENLGFSYSFDSDKRNNSENGGGSDSMNSALLMYSH